MKMENVWWIYAWRGVCFLTNTFELLHLIVVRDFNRIWLLFMVIWCRQFIVWILCFSVYCVSLLRASWALSSGMQWVVHTIHQAAGKAYNRLPGPGLRWRHWADRGDNGVFTEKTGSKRCLGHTFLMYRNFLVVWLGFNCKLCNWVTSWNVNVVQAVGLRWLIAYSVVKVETNQQIYHDKLKWVNQSFET